MVHETPINITISTEAKKQLDNFCINNGLAYNEFITQALRVLGNERLRAMYTGFNGDISYNAIIERLIDYYEHPNPDFFDYNEE